MYRLDMSESAKFIRFAGAVDTDWITVILADTGCLFIEDSNETFAVLQFASNHSESETNHVFRVRKDMLKVILLDGYLEIDVMSDHVLFTMRGVDGDVRTLETDKHQAFTTAFKDKFDVIKSAAGTPFNAEVLKPLMSVAKVLRSYMEVEDGVAGVMSREGTMLFKEVTDVPDLCLSAQAASSLFSCNSVWYQCKNYVYTIEDSFGLLVAQSRGAGLDDYRLLQYEDTGAAVKVHTDFENLMKLVSKVQCSSIKYNFRKGFCEIGDGSPIYGAFVSQTQLRISEKYSKDAVVLNARVFTNIIAKLRIWDWDFRVKKHFCQLNTSGYTIICK